MRKFSKTYARGQTTPLAPPPKRRKPDDEPRSATATTRQPEAAAAPERPSPATTKAEVAQPPPKAPPKALPKPKFEVVGNAKVWQTVAETLRRTKKAGAPQCLILRGPPGVGKTSGACDAIRFCGRRCVFVHCAEIATTERNRSDLASELTVASTRRGCDDADDGRPPVLVLDDLDTLPQPLAAQMATFLASPPTCVLATCGRTLPQWLGRAAKDRILQLHLRPLLEAELRSVGRLRFEAHFEVPLPEGREVFERCARASNGDARRYLNELRLAAPGVAVHSVAPQLNEWTAAARLLYTPTDHAEAKRLVDGQNQPFLTSLMHANYMDALLVGRAASFDNESVVADVCRRADLFAEADAMRSGPTATVLPEGVHLTACVAFDAGRKTVVPPRLRHSAPSARDRAPPSDELWAIPGRRV